MKKLLILTVSVLLVASSALAHGHEHHVMGTVSSVAASSITVATTDGKSIEVALTPQTTFTKEGKTITVKEIKQGDRVVIHAEMHGDRLEAASVKIGVAKSIHE